MKESFTTDTIRHELAKISQWSVFIVSTLYKNVNNSRSPQWIWKHSVISWWQSSFIHHSSFPSSNGQIFRLLLKISVEENTQRALNSIFGLPGVFTRLKWKIKINTIKIMKWRKKSNQWTIVIIENERYFWTHLQNTK